MNAWHLIVVGLTVASVPAALDAAPAPKTSAATKESPFACNMLALSPEERRHHFDELGPALRARKTGVRELEDGYEFVFPADPATWRLLAEWTLEERRCCPFFDLALLLDREDGPLRLRLTGRPGTKAFIEEEAGDWIRR